MKAYIVFFKTFFRINCTPMKSYKNISAYKKLILFIISKMMLFNNGNERATDANCFSHNS